MALGSTETVLEERVDTSRHDETGALHFGGFPRSVGSNPGGPPGAAVHPIESGGATPDFRSAVLLACDSPPTSRAAEDSPRAMAAPIRSRSAAGQWPPIGEVEVTVGGVAPNREASSPGRSSYDQLTVLIANTESICVPSSAWPLSFNAATVAS